jgi:TetR/AcrR family transcriptional repressor of nem operon
VTTLTNKGRATRERIVAAAADLMYVQGVANTSTQDVERAANVSSSQIFHYFTDKRDLVRAVISFQTDRIMSVQEVLLAESGGMEALMAWRDAVIAMQVAFGFTGGCPIGSLASELADTDQEARVDIVTGFRRWESAIGNLLRGMQEAGELRLDADPEQLAVALLTALQGGILLSQARRDTVALETVLDAVLARVRQFVVGAATDA